jgi:hypothetical protein
VVAVGIVERFGEGRGNHHPMLLATARLHFVHASSGIDAWVEQTHLAELPDGDSSVDWSGASVLEDWPACTHEPEAGVGFGELPAAAARKRSYATWSKQLKDVLYRGQTLDTWRFDRLKLKSGQDESRAAFLRRAELAVRERRDVELNKIRVRYGKKVDAMDVRIVKARQKIEQQQDQKRYETWSTAASVGAGVLGALLGRKFMSVTTATRASTAVRGASRVLREQGDVDRATEDLAELERRYRALDAEFASVLEEMGLTWSPSDVELETVPLKPRKADIAISSIALYWSR